MGNSSNANIPEDEKQSPSNPIHSNNDNETVQSIEDQKVEQLQQNDDDQPIERERDQINEVSINLPLNVMMEQNINNSNQIETEQQNEIEIKQDDILNENEDKNENDVQNEEEIEPK